MTVLKRSIYSLFAITALSSSAVAPAHAHFKLLKPGSWIVESDLGDPQKAGPCGPEGSEGMMTNEVTTVTAGETIMVEFEETIHHPGWFRISLDEDRSKFQDIKFTGAGCTYDVDSVPTMPHDNVLVDGLAKDKELGGSNRKFMEMVKIPDKPCEKCTLQVIQVMADTIHSPPGCIYYHCADLKIVAAGGATIGSAGAAAEGGSAGKPAAAAGSTGSATAGASASAGTGGSTATATPATATAGSGGSAASKPATTTPSTAAAGSGTRSDSASTSGTAGKPSSSTSTGSAGTTSSTKTDTSTATPTEEPKADEGGCAVSQPGGNSSRASAALLSLMGVLFSVRRRQRPRA